MKIYRTVLFTWHFILLIISGFLLAKDIPLPSYSVLAIILVYIAGIVYGRLYVEVNND